MRASSFDLYPKLTKNIARIILKSNNDEFIEKNSELKIPTENHAAAIFIDKSDTTLKWEAFIIFSVFYQRKYPCQRLISHINGGLDCWNNVIFSLVHCHSKRYPCHFDPAERERNLGHSH